MKDKRRRVVLLIGIVLIGLVSGAVGWAEEKTKEPRFMVIAEEDIIPGKMETYMQAHIAGAKLAAQHKFEFPYLTFVQDFRVTTVWFFHAFAQIDGAPQMFEEWNKRTGGKSKQLEKQGQSCVDRVSTWVNVARPDLSYWPKEPAFKADFSKPFYISIAAYHIQPGKYEEAEAVAKKLKELQEKEQPPMGYSMEECIFGSDCSAFIAVAFAKDKAAFVELQKKLDANPDPEIEKIMADSVHLLKKIETKEGTFVPEASYIPPGTFDEEN